MSRYLNAVAPVFDGGAESSEDSTHFSSLTDEIVELLFREMTHIQRHVELRANFGAGSFSDGQELMKLR